MGIDLTPELLDQIDRYLKKELSNEENSMFLERLQQDDELREEVILQKQLYSTINSKEWMEVNGEDDRVAEIGRRLKSKELQKTSKSIRNIGKAYVEENQQKPMQKRRRFTPYYAAAAVLLLLIVSIFVLTQNDSLADRYYANVAWSELPSVIEKSSDEDQLALAEQFFKAGKYKQVIQSLKQVDKSDPRFAISLMYLGAAYDLAGNKDLALKAFDELSNLKNSLDRSKGYWYKLLIYLKAEDLDNSLKILEVIKQDPSNFNYQKAVELYDELQE